MATSIFVATGADQQLAYDERVDELVEDALWAGTLFRSLEAAKAACEADAEADADAAELGAEDEGPMQAEWSDWRKAEAESELAEGELRFVGWTTWKCEELSLVWLIREFQL